MSLAAILYLLLFLAGQLRLRRRLRALPLLPTIEPGELTGQRLGRWLLLTAPEYEPDPATLLNARRYARVAGWEALDLVPGRWDGLSLVGWLSVVDPNAVMSQPFARAHSAGHALLVEESLVRRLGPRWESLARALDSQTRNSGSFARAELPPDQMIELARECKRCAPRGFGLALAPDLVGQPLLPSLRFESLQWVFGQRAPAVLLLQGLILGGLLVLLLLQPLAGMVAILGFQLQAPLALTSPAGWPAPLSAWWRSQRLALAATRLIHELNLWSAAMSSWWGSEEPAAVQTRRTHYRKLEQQRPDFFAEEVTHCPVCGSESLKKMLHLEDHWQHKPGQFRLVRCQPCGHVFQNPPLAAAGLNYHYGDFYDGLGAEEAELVFGFGGTDRFAELVAQAGEREPRRWLDLGGGHGQLTMVGRTLYPDTRFDVLDMGEEVAHAVRRGRADAAWRGSTDEWAPRLAGRYDTVSMSHYLEHCADPLAELKRASTLLAPGGQLLIEVPDPDCRYAGGIFGAWWVGWFQPQHLHLLSRSNLVRLAEQAGFTVDRVRSCGLTREGHWQQRVITMASAMAAPPDVPWRPPSPFPQRLTHALTWCAALPALLLAGAVDRIFLARKQNTPGFASAFQLIARRPLALAAPEGAPEDSPVQTGQSPEIADASLAPESEDDRAQVWSRATGDLSTTALFTSQVWSRSGFAGAELLAHPRAQVVYRVASAAIGLRRSGASTQLTASLAQRHALIDVLLDRFLKSHPNAVVVELACGLSARSARFSDRPEVQSYLEVDLPATIQTRRLLLARTPEGRALLQRDSLQMIGGDISRLPFERALPRNAPLFVIAEGLLMYLGATAQRAFQERVAALFRQHPDSQLVFDLVPGPEQPQQRPLLARAMRAATGSRGFVVDTRTRDDIAAELRTAGFGPVELLDTPLLAEKLQLPHAGQPTQQLVFLAHGPAVSAHRPADPAAN